MLQPQAYCQRHGGEPAAQHSLQPPACWTQCSAGRCKLGLCVYLQLQWSNIQPVHSFRCLGHACVLFMLNIQMPTDIQVPLNCLPTILECPLTALGCPQLPSTAPELPPTANNRPQPPLNRRPTAAQLLPTDTQLPHAAFLQVCGLETVARMSSGCCVPSGHASNMRRHGGSVHGALWQTRCLVLIWLKFVPSVACLKRSSP